MPHLWEHMHTCVHAHTETPQANKITQKIRKKQRAPSEKKKARNIRTVPMRTCVHVHTLKEITALGLMQYTHWLADHNNVTQ